MRRGNCRIRDDRLFVNDRIALAPRNHVPVVALRGIEVGLTRGVLIDKHLVCSFVVNVDVARQADHKTRLRILVPCATAAGSIFHLKTIGNRHAIRMHVVRVRMHVG